MLATLRGALVAALASVAGATWVDAPATASTECAEALSDWIVIRGALRARPTCGAYLGFTDAGSGVFSYADFLYKKPVRAPIDVAVTWRRLGPEAARSLELRTLGGLVLVRDGDYGLYSWNESTFAWRPLPGYRDHDEHRVTVHETATTLSLSIDGVPIDSWPVVATGEGQVGVAAKGAVGYRSPIEFRDFSVTSQ